MPKQTDITKFKRADLSRVRTITIKNRKSKVTPRDFANPFDERKKPYGDS